MAKWIIVKIPDNFDPEKFGCVACPWQSCQMDGDKCPIYHAKEAVEITHRVLNWNIDVKIGEDGRAAKLEASFGGSPATLYAVKEDK